MILALVLSLTLVSGCGLIDRLRPVPEDGYRAAQPAAPATDAAPVAAAPVPVLGPGKTAAALDTTTAAQKQAALAAPAARGEQSLGKVAVSLGSPAEPGIWLRSALVKVAGKGRVVTAAGTSVAVDLMPGDGAAQLSLAGYRALGLGLTDLPEVTVYAN